MEVGSRVFLDPGNIGTVGGEDPLAEVAGAQGRTSGPDFVPVRVNGAKFGFRIEPFTGDIGVVHLPIVFDLLITAPPAAPAPVFPLLVQTSLLPL
jgi:hypothetical protein